MTELHHRYLESLVRDDLEEKMVFLGGPRQVGKTTLAGMISAGARSPAYFNWDRRSHRKAILQGQWSPETDLIVFDELHKHPKWKSLIKGIWDTREHSERILLTGSSRLDVYRRGGDSLLGRYHYYRLHPFSLREVHSKKPEEVCFRSTPPELRFEVKGSGLDILLRMGGFPEPFLSARERTLKRWQRERFERVFREDIRDLEAVRSLAQVELLGAMLPERVGSPLSVRALSEDLEASPKTVKSWIQLLSRNYYVFKVPPYHRRLSRALKKESKYYLWDWSEVRDQGGRFENLVASHLLKYCHFLQDALGLSVELHYLRDREKREVDFLVTWEREPWLMVECKSQAKSGGHHLAYFGERLNVARRYLVTAGESLDYVDKKHRVRVIPAAKFLMALA